MHKISSDTAARMLELIKTDTYQGKVIFLLFGFMLKTDASPNEAARTTFDDVYKNGQPRKAIALGKDARCRSLLVGAGLRKTIEALWLVQVRQGLVPTAQSALQVPERQGVRRRRACQHTLALPGSGGFRRRRG